MEKADKYNKAATKRTDSKQSWQHFPQNITKTRQFKYIENFTIKRGKFSDKKNRIFFTITKTRLYNVDPLKPLFYIVKLGFTGVYIIFLISAQNRDCGYSLEPPRRCGSNEYPQSMF